MRSLTIAFLLLLSLSAYAIPREWYAAGRAGEMVQSQARLARLALTRSSNPDLRRHARHILEQNQTLFHRLSALADQREMPMSSGPTAEQEESFQATARLEGPAFEAAYWQQQKATSERLAALCTDAGVEALDPALHDILVEYAHMKDAAGR